MDRPLSQVKRYAAPAVPSRDGHSSDTAIIQTRSLTTNAPSVARMHRAAWSGMRAPSEGHRLRPPPGQRRRRANIMFRRLQIRTAPAAFVMQR